MPMPGFPRPAARVAVLAVLILGASPSAFLTPAVAAESPLSSSLASSTLDGRSTSITSLRSRNYARSVTRSALVRRMMPRSPVPAVVPSPSPSASVTAAPVPAIAVPAGAITIAPGQDLAAVAAANPAGSTFLLLAGTHRLQSVEPKDGTVFVGAPGAVLSGARLLRSFTASGGGWYVDGQTQQGVRQGECRTIAPLCNHPDRVFMDGAPLTPVAARDALRAGTFYFDYSADRIWLGSDPAGHLVEAAVTPRAFAGRGTGVVIRSLVVEKYATPAQRGAVDASDGSGWVIEDVTARLNAGGGLRGGVGTTIRRSRAMDNGQIGITAIGRGVLVEDCEIARNNTQGFQSGWEAGGTKFALTDGLVVRRCNVHHNQGPGLWTDVDNVRTTYEGNTVTSNTGEGIFHEISGSAVIRNNIVRGNSPGSNPWVWGAGIHVASSFDVEVHGNTVEGNGNGIVGSQQNRGSGPNGPRVLRGLQVHDNVVRSSGKVGVSQDVSDQGVFTSRGNVFDRNHYETVQVFTWADRDFGFTAWRNYGHDRNGTAG